MKVLNQLFSLVKTPVFLMTFIVAGLTFSCETLESTFTPEEFILEVPVEKVGPVPAPMDSDTLIVVDPDTGVNEDELIG